MDDLVMSLIVNTVSNKVATGVFPSDATLSGMINEIKSSLYRLHEQGKIKVGDTINDKYIKVL